MAWLGNELWFVNTAFSCLAVRSDSHSFAPRWWPSFISQLAPIDACHLNGLAVRDDRPAYVTALGATGESAGWRECKRNGGVLISVEQDAVVLGNLSMPHSPRWYRDRLWLCESGDGTFGYIDPRYGCYEVVSRLPGFTRGLAFLDRYALIGLSQIRETAVFSGIPLVERAAERVAGVWVVDIGTGETVGFVRFETGVQEIFAVEVLRGANYPDVINDDIEIIGGSFVLPDEVMSLVPTELRGSER
jgi:uncharacterized protein (TIGR03032 family)